MCTSLTSCLIIMCYDCAKSPGWFISIIVGILNPHDSRKHNRHPNTSTNTGLWLLLSTSDAVAHPGGPRDRAPPCKNRPKKMAVEHGGLYFMFLGPPPSPKFLDLLLWGLLRFDCAIRRDKIIWKSQMAPLLSGSHSFQPSCCVHFQYIWI